MSGGARFRLHLIRWNIVLLKFGQGAVEVVGPSLVFAVSENSLRKLSRRLCSVRKVLVNGTMHIDQQSPDNGGLLTGCEFKKSVGNVPAQNNSISK